jgi:glycosyltransferase involved in cell wall biosynthesis
VSIGLPVYNGERFVTQAIQALLGQTFEDFELVIVDNASTDGTAEICRSFAARDRRVRYHRNPQNIGGAPNFRRAFHLATVTPYFKWAAHDDLHSPEYLAECVAVLDADPGAILCHSATEIIDGGGNLVTNPDPEHLASVQALDLTDVADERPSVRFRNLILSDHMCLDGFGVIRRDELAKMPGHGSYVGSDRPLVAELGLRGKFRRVDRPLFQNRDFDGRSTRSIPLRKRGGWFSPALEGQIIFPYWRYLLEYNRSILRVPLAPQERLACWRTLVDWVKRNRWQMQYDVRFAYEKLRARSSAER